MRSQGGVLILNDWCPAKRKKGCATEACIQEIPLEDPAEAVAS